MRHKWPDEPEEGLLVCLRCGMGVKAYLVKRGGLPPCPGKPSPFTQTRLEDINQCRYHQHGLLGGNVRCLACGKSYTEEEKRRFEALKKRDDPLAQELHNDGVKKKT